MFYKLHTAPSAAAGGARGVQPGSGGSNSAGQHPVPISCLVHAHDGSNTPDRWYSAGSDGIVQVWNGKVGWRCNDLSSSHHSSLT